MNHRADVSALLRDNMLRICFQPIVSLASGRPIGYEALTRGPEGTVWEAPLRIFEAAGECGMLGELECHVRSLAVNSYRWGPGLPKLFINFNPEFSCGLPILRPAENHHRCAGCNECPLVSALDRFREQVVLELPESLALRATPQARKLVHDLRSLGISLALDDYGSGFGDIERLLSTRPDWIKLDRNLIHKLDKDPWRQAVVKQLAGLQGEITVNLIAEGVETAAELDALVRLGVRFAQGFLLGRPAPLDVSCLSRQS